MPEPLYFLNEADVKVLKYLAAREKKLRQNIQFRTDETDYAGISPTSPEVFVALSPGIPANEYYSSESAWQPGSAVCNIYSIDPDTLCLTSINFQETVYNLSTTPIPAGTGSIPLYIPVLRDKPGSWIAINPSNVAGSTTLTVEYSDGTSPITPVNILQLAIKRGWVLTNVGGGTASISWNLLVQYSDESVQVEPTYIIQVVPDEGLILEQLDANTVELSLSPILQLINLYWADLGSTQIINIKYFGSSGYPYWNPIPKNANFNATAPVNLAYWNYYECTGPLTCTLPDPSTRPGCMIGVEGASTGLITVNIKDGTTFVYLGFAEFVVVTPDDSETYWDVVSTNVIAGVTRSITNFTLPAIQNVPAVTLNVSNTYWMIVGSTISINDGTNTAMLRVYAITGANSVLVVNLGGTVFPGGSLAPPGTVFNAGALVETVGIANPMTTIGDIIYATTNGVPQRLSIGLPGDVLTVAGGIPEWEPITSPTCNEIVLNIPDKICATSVISNGQVVTTVKVEFIPNYINIVNSCLVQSLGAAYCEEYTSTECCGSGTGSGSGSGTGTGGIITDCCPDGVPTILYITFTSGPLASLTSVPIVYDAGLNSWWAYPTICGGTTSIDFYCQSGGSTDWGLVIVTPGNAPVYTPLGLASNCNPLSWSGVYSIPYPGCTGSGTVMVTT